METYILNIEFINNYLNNLLSKEERLNFESKLKTDAEFYTLYQDHVVFVNGLKRVQVKDDILKAKRSYTTEKWLKISGITIVIIGALIMLYTLVFNTSESEPSPNHTPLNTIVADSTFKQEPSEEKQLDTLDVNTTDSMSEIDVDYTSTTVNRKYGSVTTNSISLTKKAQHVALKAQNDTTITYKEGTILKIKGGSFINPNTGAVVTGPIQLSVTEYYKLSDILLQNLSTVSNGKQLETGGMLYIEAKQGNTTLELKDNAPIEILFPTANKKTGMQLFSGEWKDQNINWTLQNDILEVVDIDDLSEELVEVPLTVVEQAPTFPGCEAEDNETRKKCTENAISKFINKNFNTDIARALELSGQQRINCIFKIDQEGNISYVQTRAPHPRLSEEADRVINMLPRFNPGMQRGKPVIVPYSLPINFTLEGTSSRTSRNSRLGTTDSLLTQIDVVTAEPNLIVRESVAMDTIYTEERGMVEMIREVMHDKDFPVDSLFLQEWDRYEKQKLIRIYGIYGTGSQKTAMLRKPLFEMDNTKFKVLEDDSITRGGHVIRKLWDPSRVPTTTRTITLVPRPRFTAGSISVSADEFDELLEDPNANISSRDVSYYALKSLNLGWVNCDRFINGRTKRIKYKLKIKNAEGATVNMVFKSYNAVLPSWYTNGVYDFKTVGDGETVVLVAIKRKDGQLYYDMIETTTVRNPKIDFNFKAVSIEELKRALEILN